MAQAKHSGRTSPRLTRSGLVAAFFAGTGAGMVAQNAHADGIVRCWGWNYAGQCDVPVDLGACTAVAAGDNHTMALRSDGNVRVWGRNLEGQCNVPTDLGPCSAIAAGKWHSISLRSDGVVRAWGSNDHGQCNVPTDLGPCSAIAGGHSHTVAVAIQTLTCTADLNHDNNVNGADLGVLLGQWATAGGTTGADINADGTVNGADLGLMLGAWGPCPN